MKTGENVFMVQKNISLIFLCLFLFFEKKIKISYPHQISKEKEQQYQEQVDIFTSKVIFSKYQKYKFGQLWPTWDPLHIEL